MLWFMGWRVQVRSGAADRLITVGEELTIGRGVEGDGGLPDDRKVSRRHARFLLGADGGLLVEDLKLGERHDRQRHRARARLPA